MEKAKGKPDAAALQEAREAGRTKGLAQCRAEIEKAVRGALAAAGDRLRALAEDLGPGVVVSGDGEPIRPMVVIPPARDVATASRPAPKVAAALGDGVTNPQQRVLDAVATLMVLGVVNITKEQAALVAGVKPTSGSIGNNVGRLRTLGLLAQSSGDGLVTLTEAGRRVANFPDKPPSIDALHQILLSLLTNPQAVLLKAVIKRWPKPISKSDLAEAAGVQPTSGSFGNNLGRLRTLSMIDYPERGFVAATELLFPG